VNKLLSPQFNALGLGGSLLAMLLAGRVNLHLAPGGGFEPT
jgi:hypothetical protein